MRLISVHAKNFRSYKSLDWNLKQDGLFLIDGENLDNGRSNMSGKSTLLDSIAWCLYGYLSKWGGPKGGQADAVIRRGEKSCEVTVSLERGADSYLITRKRPASLSILKNGIEVQGKKADLETRLVEALGMTPEQFYISVYISQDRQSSFFTMGDTERTQLLSTIAGLEKLDQALTHAKDQKREIESNLDRSLGAVAVLEEQVSKFPEEAAQLSVRADALKKDVAFAYGHYFDASTQGAAQIEELRMSHLSELTDLETAYRSAQNSAAEAFMVVRDELSGYELSLKSLPKMEPAYTQAIVEVRAKIKEAEDFNESQKRAQWKNQSLLAEIKKVLDQAEHVSQGTCGECRQALPNWDASQAALPFIEKATQLESQLQVVQPSVDLAFLKQTEQAAQEVYAKRKSEIEAEPSRLQREIVRLNEKSKLNQRDRESATVLLQKEKKSKEQTLTIAMTEIQQSWKELEQGYQAIDRRLEEVKLSAEKLKEQEAQAQEKLRTHKVKVFTLQKEIDQILDLIDLFGPKGLRVIYFDDIIRRISARAGELFSLMTDGVYSSRVDQIGETAKGEAKLILRPIVTKGGTEVPMDDLSGGARRMAMLAYDVAVSESVGDSSALFLDEALDGLDAQGKAEAMRLLEEVGRSRAVYIIDHSSELRASVMDVVRVLYKDGISSIEGEQAGTSDSSQERRHG